MSTITEPGIYDDLPNADYHAQTSWLSSTYIKGALPELHDSGGGSQAALDFGTLVHSIVLEPDNLDGYVVLDAHAIAGDNPKTGKPYDAPEMTAKYKAARAEAWESGKPVVTQDDWDRAHRMRDAVAAHPEAASLLMGDGRSEVSVFAVDADAEVAHKARYDRLIPGAIVDLKTTAAKPGADSLSRVVANYLYDLSAAHYLAVAELAGIDAAHFTWVFVGKSEPYYVTVADASPEYIARGRALRDLALARLLGDDGHESYQGATGRLTLSPPGWLPRIAPATTTTIPADFTWSLNDYYQDA